MAAVAKHGAASPCGCHWHCHPCKCGGALHCAARSTELSSLIPLPPCPCLVQMRSSSRLHCKSQMPWQPCRCVAAPRCGLVGHHWFPPGAHRICSCPMSLPIVLLGAFSCVQLFPATTAPALLQMLQQAVATEQALSWPLVNCLMSPLECLVPHPAFRQSAAVRAQRLSRHLMNVLASVR